MSFMPVTIGPSEDPWNLIGFIQRNGSGFEAFDIDKGLLGGFAIEDDAAGAIWSACLGVKSRSNGGGASTVGGEPRDPPEGNTQAVGEDDGGNLTFTDRGLFGVEAFDNGISIGKFSDQEAAIDSWKQRAAAGNGSDPHPMMTAALNLSLRRDWTIFPADLTGKAKKSYKSAKYSGGAAWGKTKDLTQIRRDFQRWPEANVGIPTEVENGIFDIEGDTKEGHGVDGLASLSMLEAKYGKLPDTLMAESPTGSLHRIYNHPGRGIKVISRGLPGYPGVDIKGDGGMFIAPPSVRGDGVYRWLNDLPIADAPPWLIALVTSRGNGKDHEPAPRFKVAEAFKHLDPAAWASESSEYWFDQLQPEQKDEVVDHALKTIASKTPLFEIQEDGGDNDQWFRLVTAVARSSAPNAEDIFIKYAAKAKNPDPEDALREKFAYCQKNPRGITVGTLLGFARDHGADFGPWRSLQPDSPAALERRTAQVAENIKIGDDVTEPVLPQIMTLKEMHKRLVFVGSIGVVADCATGRIRKKEHAVDEYAASQHSWMQGNQVKKAPALKCWIASKDRVTVEVLTWVPGADQICQPPEGPGPAFNTWRGLSPMAYPSDWQERVKPCIEHIEYLVPVEAERERFLDWLAHIFQVPEVLPHTSYLMITPTTGIGRNLLASILVRALRGFVAAGVSLPELLDGGFTGRLSKKLLIIVDEAREGRGERRYERAEHFKRLQTEEHRHVNHKYGYQSVEKNCGRWLKFSQHDDAIPFDNSDRRVIVIANPTIRKEDAYYARLYGLLGDKDFIGSVRHWLETRVITAFRPGEHAPMNAAKLRAINEMMNETECAVAEFKEDCETELTSRGEIKHYIARDRDSDPFTKDAHLNHAIRRAGMINTGRRIWAYHEIKARNDGRTYYAGSVTEKRFSVVIVRGEWTTEMVKKADPGKILKAMGLGDWSAGKLQR